MSTSDYSDPEPLLTASDVYRASREGVLSQEEASRLVSWAYEERKKSESVHPASRFRSRKINSETVASYAGALLMIAATNWLLGATWEGLAPATTLVLGSLYALGAVSWSRLLGEQGRVLQSGLLMTVAVAQTPLIVYSLQNMLDWWPGGETPPYGFLHMMFHPAWVVLELATVAVALLALKRVRFSFVAAPLGYSCLLLARDLPLWFAGYPRININWYFSISAAVGLLTVLLARNLSRRQTADNSFGGEDIAFWPYLFGSFALLRALSSLAFMSTFYLTALLFFGLMMLALGVRERRKTFLVFGALGLDQGLMFLAHLRLPNSFFFPFFLIGVGAYLLVRAWPERKTRIAF